MKFVRYQASVDFWERLTAQGHAYWSRNSKLRHAKQLWVQNGTSVYNKRLNTGRAPICDWMIKIVKVNKSWGLFIHVSRSGTMKYQYEWKHRRVNKKWLLTLWRKGRVFLVQRGGSAIFRQWKSHPLTKLI